jgi:hypothetical protein
MKLKRPSPNTVLSRYAAILTIGSILLAASIAGIVFSGMIVIRDETNRNITGPSSLPKSGVGPLSMYHVEYGFVFLSIASFAAVFWGWTGRHEQKHLANKSSH